MDKKNLITMLANAECDFKVENGYIIIPLSDTGKEAVFRFNKDGELTNVWSRE